MKKLFIITLFSFFSALGGESWELSFPAQPQFVQPYFLDNRNGDNDDMNDAEFLHFQHHSIPSNISYNSEDGTLQLKDDQGGNYNHLPMPSAKRITHAALQANQIPDESLENSISVEKQLDTEETSKPTVPLKPMKKRKLPTYVFKCKLCPASGPYYQMVEHRMPGHATSCAMLPLISNKAIEAYKYKKSLTTTDHSSSTLLSHGPTGHESQSGLDMRLNEDLDTEYAASSSSTKSSKKRPHHQQSENFSSPEINTAIVPTVIQPIAMDSQTIELPIPLYVPAPPENYQDFADEMPSAKRITHAALQDYGPEHTFDSSLTNVQSEQFRSATSSVATIDYASSSTAPSHDTLDHESESDLDISDNIMIEQNAQEYFEKRDLQDKKTKKPLCRTCKLRRNTSLKEHKDTKLHKKMTEYSAQGIRAVVVNLGGGYCQAMTIQEEQEYQTKKIQVQDAIQDKNIWECYDISKNRYRCIPCNTPVKSINDTYQHIQTKKHQKIIATQEDGP